MEADPTETGVSLGLLGPVELRRDGVVIPVGAAQKRMILAALGLSSGEVVSTDRLIDAVWGERPPRSAGKALQVYVSQLRDAVEPVRNAPSVIVSQAPGYALALPPQAVDLRVFERLWGEGRRLRASDDAEGAAETLSRALSLWRGPPLADLTYVEAFSQDVSRLEEMRWTCLEDRIDADLAAGRHAQLIPDLEDLTHRYLLRERACGLLMLAYYRSGRQADALHAFRRLRATLVGDLGLEPSPALAQLERSILQHDSVLDPPVAAEPGSRTILVLGQGDLGDLDSLLPVAAPLAKGTGAEIVLVSVLPPSAGQDDDALVRMTRELSDRRALLEEAAVIARVAAFSTSAPAQDVVRFAAQQDVALILVDGTASLTSSASMVSELLASADCDVVVSFPSTETPTGRGLLVPFGGGEHDWAALELAAHLARLLDDPLVLAGADSPAGPDASRVLAVASLIIQRTVGVIPQPVMITPGPAGVVDRARDAHMIVLGVSTRYRGEGLGHVREAIVREAGVPALVVRQGRRPGLFASPDRLTQFRWSISA
jgi:DNA-binding SARP family transcriptional activator